jgi:hypothetical protein
MGSSDKTKTVTPPINAKSEDEEKFIKYVTKCLSLER